MHARRRYGKSRLQNAIKRRRVLIPAEWLLRMAGFERPQAAVLHPPRDGQAGRFAALAETWMGPNGEEMDTVAIVNRAGQPAISPCCITACR